MTVNEPTIRFKIVIPHKWTNKERGDLWEDVSADLFHQQQWKVTQNIEFVGMQTDIYVKNLYNQTGLIECKFQKRFIQAPTIYKLMGQALFKKVDFAYLLSTSDLNAKAKGVVLEYQKEQNKSYKPYDLVIWSGDELAKEFMRVHCIKVPEITQISSCVKTITLLLTHNKEFFWVAEEMGESNIPCRAIIFQTPKSKSYLSSEDWKKYFSLHKIWENLEITVFNPTVNEPKYKSTNQSIPEVEKVTVSIINQADSFDDYHRPSRPEDFFGRLEPQREFWDFVNNVRDEKTDLRVVSFSGSTGLGKSSLVLKLASDCQQKPEYKDNFYIYHVDVTSVNQEKATLFVIAAIRQALQKAIDNGFVDLPNHQVSIESVESNYFSSESIQLLIKTLKNSRKVIVIFFDQFEEILTRDSLSYLYDLFKQAAYDVDSLKENIVLGFCWRTDVNLPTTNPAYFTWHNLAKVRKDIYFSEFSQQDSSSLLDGFKKYLNSNQKGSRLPSSIKKWLLDNCQNQPWLLKRFCGDIYNQRNISELDPKQKKVITKFDIKRIFEEDIKRATVTPECNSCLRYIAKCSPVSIMDVDTKFNVNVINSLLKSKLVILTGENYKIYWDMFREYLLDGKLPEMIISYIPRTKISVLLKIFRLLKSCETISDLESESGKKKSTVTNAVLDLQNFFQVTRNKENGKIIVSEIFLNLKDEEIAEKLAEQIEAHVVIKKIYEELEPGEWMRLAKVQKLLHDGKTKSTTPKDYASRMLSWFHFAGLLEVKNGRIFRPTHPKQGIQKGKPEKCEPQYEPQPKSDETPGQLSLFLL